MEPILGIDLGTTNSAASIIDISFSEEKGTSVEQGASTEQGAQGKPRILRDDRGEIVLPSVVGIDRDGKVLVGQEARNQALLAPERTVCSIKRKMGQDETIRMGESQFSPQEISAMILRTLKDRASKAYGSPLTQAVITVPALFNENQREATREAGELAGLEVVRIINEPTAASLMYEPDSEKIERLLVYDLGGGTFDVSIVQVEQGVVEVLASHGNTQLGGDDFDRLLLDHVCDDFLQKNGVDLREIPTAKSRMLQAVEQAKKQLSDEAFTTISEEFIAKKDDNDNGDGGEKPLHLEMEINRSDYEALIEPLLQKTLLSIDAALEDAKLTAENLDRVILVGGSTRTPLVHHLLQEQLQCELHSEIDPDLCVSLGAAVQGGLIAGIDVGPILVDITPHTLGIECLGEAYGRPSHTAFAPIIARNTPLPATRSEIYHTSLPGQKKVRIQALQGEDEDAQFNEPVGDFLLEGLNEDADEGSEILVRFDLNLDGILTVTAVERETRLEKKLQIDNAITRFRAGSRAEAKSALGTLFGDTVQQASETEPHETSMGGVSSSEPFSDTAAQDSGAQDTAAIASPVIAKARQWIGQAPQEDAEEIRELVSALEAATASQETDRVSQVEKQLEDILFYLDDA